MYPGEVFYYFDNIVDRRVPRHAAAVVDLNMRKYITIIIIYFMEQ